MLSPDLQRLARIRDYCEEIEGTITRCEGSFDHFNADKDFQRSIAFSVLQIGELVGGLTEEYRTATRDCIPWSLIKGMRNIVAHDYGNIDLEVVWDSATKNIPTLKEFCDEQLGEA